MLKDKIEFKRAHNVVYQSGYFIRWTSTKGQLQAIVCDKEGQIFTVYPRYMKIVMDK